MGVASTICDDGSALPSASAMKKRTRSSTPIFAVLTARSFRSPATSAVASSSSCHTRTSFENLITSRARAPSNAGAT